jgi:hypothetical protein
VKQKIGRNIRGKEEKILDGPLEDVNSKAENNYVCRVELA